MKGAPKVIIPRILRINSREGYRISCLFSNGEHRILDFEHIFKEVYKVVPGDVDYPLLQDPDEFAQVKLEGFSLIWPNVGHHSHDENGDPVFYAYEPDTFVLFQNSEPDPRLDIDIPQTIRSLRLSQGMTQAELAAKSGTSKKYISRLENSHADIELLTLKRIVEGGLGRHLDISIR